MSESRPDADTVSATDAPLDIAVPSDPLAGAPATAYFWGHVAGSGDVSDGAVRNEARTADGPRRSRARIEVVTNDEASAGVLAAIAGGEVARETTTREYAHDTSITRTENEYTVSIAAERGADEGGADVDGHDDTSTLLGRESRLGLPVDGRGTYRFGAFATHERELLRGLFEGCGTICFKSSTGTVGISFVHDDRELLELVRDLLADCPVDPPVGDLAESSSGGYWFGIDDAAAPAFGTWCYENCEETGLFAPSRRRKLERSLEQAAAYDDEEG